jgi:hypothetical protein
VYSVFKNIPLQIRRQAFAAMVQHKRGPAETVFRLDIGNETYCPLGVINRALLASNLVDEDAKQRVVQEYAGSYGLEILLPPGPFTETSILKELGINVKDKDVSRFMIAVDTQRILGDRALATAMGVPYTAQGD